ncbi:MAG: hypothetical protein H0X25_11215 [Acidobacteriales bacterium]|nr:hypothetical protein [Terriglobales bacterium]
MKTQKKKVVQRKVVPSRPPSGATIDTKVAADSLRDLNSSFVKGVLTRGEAAERDSEGKIASQATHEIEKSKDGSVQIKRVRFKAF